MRSDTITITDLPAAAGDWSTGKLSSRGVRTAGYLWEKGEGKSSSPPSDPRRSLILKLAPFAAHNVFSSCTYTLPPGLTIPSVLASQQPARTMRRQPSALKKPHILWICICALQLYFYTTACFSALYCI